MSGNGQALAVLPFPQEHLSFGSCFTSALGNTFNFSSSELVLSLTKYELEKSMKILNTSLVCRKDGVEVYETVCPSRDGLCTVSIPDMKMVDELID